MSTWACIHLRNLAYGPVTSVSWPTLSNKRMCLWMITTGDMSRKSEMNIFVMKNTSIESSSTNDENANVNNNSENILKHLLHKFHENQIEICFTITNSRVWNHVSFNTWGLLGKTLFRKSTLFSVSWVYLNVNNDCKEPQRHSIWYQSLIMLSIIVNLWDGDSWRK